MGVATPQERLVDALYRIVRQVHTTGDLPALLQRILEEARSLLGAGASSLFLYDDAAGELVFEVVVGRDADMIGTRIPLGEGIVGSCAERRETLIVHDVTADDRYLELAESGFTTQSLVAAPMIRKDRLIGVLEVLNKHEGRFDDTDAKILAILAEQAAVLIENTRLIRERIDAERRAALGTVAAGLAHYVNNVVGQMQGSARLIEHGLEQGDLEVIRRSWPLLRRSADRIGDLVQDMLALSRSRSPEREAVDVNELAHQVTEAERERAVQLGVDLHLATDPGLAPVQADRDALYEVMTNLVSNALDALAHHDGDRRIDLATSRDDGGVRIEVRDTGPGMAEGVRLRAFEPFFSTKGSQGTGLGLALLHKRVQEHGGWVDLRSSEGGGTRVTVWLPAG